MSTSLGRNVDHSGTVLSGELNGFVEVFAVLALYRTIESGASVKFARGRKLR